MSTPNGQHVKIAEICPLLLETIKAAIEKNVSIRNDVNDVVNRRIEPESMSENQKMQDTLLNRAMEYARRISDIITAENQTCKEAFFFTQEEMAGNHKPDNITKNTALRHKAKPGSLVAKVGYDECIKRLKKVTAKDKKNRIVTRGAACKCFGFTGSEHHFLEVWASLRAYGTNAPLKTYGILRFDAINKGYKWDELMDFAKEYYDNYHVGMVRKILHGKGFSIKRIKGEPYLKSDD